MGLRNMVTIKSSKTLMLGVALMLTGCSQEMLVENIKSDTTTGKTPESISVSVQEFGNVYEETGVQTRSSVVVDLENSNYQFVWAEDDQIGIFPNEGGQVAFPMTNGAGTQNAVFNGGGWGLKSSSTYSAYYPIVPEFYLDRTDIPVNLSNQKQVGNANYDHIGKLDYMAAVNSTVNEEGQVNFAFQHLISVLHLVITVPSAGQYNSVMLMASDNLTTKASLDLSSGDVEGKTVTPLQILQLQDTEVATDGGTLEVFMVIRPVDLTNKVLKARIYAASGEVYVVTLTSRNYEAGNFYHSARTAVVDETNTGLPIAFVNTPCAQSAITHDDWQEGSSLTILMPDGTIDEIGSMQIKGRGNSTWEYVKKPYALKLDNKKEVMGMAEHKRWCLLANWMDRTMMRNAVSFEIAKKCPGLDWTPSGKFVEVVFNGVHRGNYYLCEQIKVDKKRVNIAKLDNTVTEGVGITGGFIMELDVYYDEVNKFKSAIKNLPWMFKDPDDVNSAQLSYMQDYVNAMEDALYDDTKFAAREFTTFMDLDSFVDWWFVYELAMNGEPCHPKSTYMNKDKNGVIKAGPVWDFDWGTYAPGNTSMFRIKNSVYYGQLFKDETFKALVKNKWAAQKTKFEEVYDFIDGLNTSLAASNAINNTMWPLTGRTTNGDESMTFEEAVSRLKNAYQAKLEWMDGQISAW